MKTGLTRPSPLPSYQTQPKTKKNKIWLLRRIALRRVRAAKKASKAQKKYKASLDRRVRYIFVFQKGSLVYPEKNRLKTWTEGDDVSGQQQTKKRKLLNVETVQPNTVITEKCKIFVTINVDRLSITQCTYKIEPPHVQDEKCKLVIKNLV